MQDTTLRKLLIAAEQSKILKVQISLYEEREVLLQKLIDEQDEKYNLSKDFYTKQIINLEGQVSIYKDQIKGYEKLLRRERLKRKLITGAGIITTGLSLFLTLKK